MQFKQYLKEGRATEIESVENFNWALNRNCKPYLNLIKSLQHPFIREMSNLDYDLGIQIVRQDRKPRGTDPKVFKMFNDWLQKNGHNRRDNSAIAAYVEPRIFGRPYYIFPMGKFSYSWIEAEDVNMDDWRTGWGRSTTNYYVFWNDEMKNGVTTRLKKPFKDYFHTDEGIETAAKKGYEVWFNCKRYMFISSGGSKYGWHVKKKIMIEFK